MEVFGINQGKYYLYNKRKIVDLGENYISFFEQFDFLEAIIPKKEL